MKTAIAAVGMLLLAACSNSEPAAAPKPMTSASAAPAPARPGQLAGQVVETVSGGGYTYVRVATASGEEWAAMPQATIAKGDEIVLDVQMTMENFESKSLGRTFDRIAFATMAGGKSAPAAAQAPEQHMASPDIGPLAVEKAPGGATVAELYAGKDSLNGKDVVVRGKVVKYLAGIMGTNWMHIQDGSGSKEKGDNDLTVTTSGGANVGEVVTIKGKLAVDKDFGSGYRYAVIVEDATVTK